MMKMEFSKPDNGIYKVEMRLGEEDASRIRSVLKEESEFKKLCEMKGNVLEYKSETVLPLEESNPQGKQKILMVFGNPAINSVVHGMFYFSKSPRKDGDAKGKKFPRHQMWSKLEEAGLIRRIRVDDKDSFRARKAEARKRKELLLQGNTLNRYLVGLTTFYSFPTPVVGKYKNVSGVKRVFGKKLLEKIKDEEIKRLRGYRHFEDACLIFAQKSSYEVYRAKALESSRVYYWPGVRIMQEGSGGDGLKKIIERRCV
jgi:hypothetical protein